MNIKDIIENIQEKIGETLAFGPKEVIGVDIGLSAIKMAEVSKTNDGSFKLMSYASVDLPEGAIIEDEIQNEDDVLAAIQECYKQLRSSRKYACVGLSGPNTILKRLQLAGGDAEEIEDQVNWESEQYLPFPIDEGNITFSVVGENAGGGVDVVIGAARKNVVNNFKELVERTGLKVKIMDHTAAAMLNVIEYSIGEIIKGKGKTYIIIEYGAQKSSFMIYKNSVMVFHKDINIGGLTITEEIQRQMGVNYEEAESLKIQGDGSGNIPEEVVEIINQVLETFFAELKKTIDFWVSSTSEETFDGLILTGGGSLIPGFAESMQELIETEVQIFDPFPAILVNESRISEDMLPNISAMGVVAIGLAMRSLAK